MKKLLLLIPIIIAVLFISCKLPNESEDYPTPPDYNEGFDMVFDIPDLGLSTTAGVMDWVATWIDYVSDQIHDVDEYWQNPYQTYTWLSGDCEDYSILSMYLIYRDVEPLIPEMVVGHINGESGLHAWVRVNGVEWEPQSGEIVTTYTILYTIPYEEAIYRSNTTHKAIRMK